MSNHNRIKLHFIPDAGWHKFRGVQAKGAAFVGNQLLITSELAGTLSAHSNFDTFLAIVRKLNGYFAIVLTADDKVFLAVDHVRSSPLFYAVKGKDAFVSDDANWVREQANEQKIDEVSLTEFLLGRSVSGRDTLSPSVKQVQAGEVVALLLTSQGVYVKSTRLYLFGYTRAATGSFASLANAADLALESAFSRLAKYADGRTVVVPLSGGIDSRLTVLMLKRVGYDRVVTFSYGRPGNRESKISRQVALRLNLPWIFIPYSNESWRRWYNTKEWMRYSRFANGLSTTPHLQDFPGIWELRRKHLIPEDSIFVPGHAPIRLNPADNPLELPVEWLKKTRITSNELTSRICDGYLTLQDSSRLRNSTRLIICEKIGNMLQPPRALMPEQAIEYIDRWWWETSESKFMINSVRVYDFWGYRWWLPLWDTEFVHFWSKMPFHLRFEKRFAKAYVRRLESKITGKTPVKDSSPNNSRSLLVRILNKVHLRNPARQIRSRLEYRHDQYAWYGLIPEQYYKRIYHGQENINTYLANQTVKTIFPNYTIPEDLDLHQHTKRLPHN